jgi:aspartyl-tRNA(Asn)/glutamyl-tRNA(Gln) amidotransferase subunit C
MPVQIDVEHVARLARLALTEEERERFGRQLAVILEHAERVGELATEDVEPTSHPIPRSNVFRSDQPGPTLSHDDALAGAPDAEGGRFRVPRIVEEEG